MFRNFHILLFLLFLILASPTCLHPEEQDGQCSKCSPLQVLVHGHCYRKIRGCLKHEEGPVCVQCLYGYVKVDGLCVRQAVYFKKTNLEFIAPVKLDVAPKLTLAQILDKIAKEYGASVSKVHFFLLNKYKQHLKTAEIAEATSLQSKRTTVASITYKSGSKRYEAVVLLNYLQEMEIIDFKILPLQNQNTLSIGQKNTFSNLRKRINEKYVEIREVQYLFDILYSKQQFTLVFFGRNLLVYKVLVQKSTLQVTAMQPLFRKDLALQKALSLHSQLKQYQNKTQTNYIDDTFEYYIFQFDALVSVSVQFRNYHFIVNKPFRKNAGSENFQQFFFFIDIRYINSVKEVVEEIPELAGVKIVKVEAKLVEKVNIKFKIHFLQESEKIDYVVIVHYAVDGKIEITDITKNDNIILSSLYDYNKDFQFLKAYAYFQTQSRIYPIPPVESVARKLQPNYIKFQVFYGPKRYSQFIINKDNNQVFLQKFIEDGQNILKIKNKLKNVQRSINTIIAYLRVKKPQIIYHEKIKELFFENGIYLIYLVVPSGTYAATIEQIGVLELRQFKKLSDITCFQIMSAQVLAQHNISRIDTFLHQNYDINGYHLQLLQINVNDYALQYRLVYSNDILQQIQFFLQQIMGHIAVTSAFVLNFGYGILNLHSDSSQFQIATELGRELFPGRIPFFSQTNKTHSKLYYEGEEATYVLTANLKEKKVDAEIVHSRKYLLVPDGFDIGLVLSKKEIEKDLKLKGCISITKNKYPDFLKESNVAFVERSEKAKINDIQIIQYKILFEAKGVYYKVLTKFKFKGGFIEIIPGPMIITSYKKEDFTRCTEFDEKGTMCLSCSSDEIEYQGNCFKLMEGCLIQPGSICLKCDSNYVIGNFKCLKECKKFF